MALLKPKDLRKMSDEELEKELEKQRKEIIYLSQTSPEKLKNIRKVIARILTILRERMKPVVHTELETEVGRSKVAKKEEEKAAKKHLKHKRARKTKRSRRRSTKSKGKRGKSKHKSTKHKASSRKHSKKVKKSTK